MIPFIQIILNPEAGGGAARKLVPEFCRLKSEKFNGEAVLTLTSKQGEASLLARNAVKKGAGLVIAAGGDGTVNEVVNGMMQSRKSLDTSCELGIVHCGTGGGLAQTLQMTGTPGEQIDVICRSNVKKLDVGYVCFTDIHGNSRERLFISELQAGIGGQVAQKATMRYKKLGGTLAFALASLMTLLSYRSSRMHVITDGSTVEENKLLGVSVGNGNYCAGGMQLTPVARPDDGKLDVLTIYQMPLLSRLQKFNKIYKGQHIHTEGFSYRSVTGIKIESDTPKWISVDGEVIGKTPCEVGIIPGALKIRCP